MYLPVFNSNIYLSTVNQSLGHATQPQTHLQAFILIVLFYFPYSKKISSLNSSHPPPTPKAKEKPKVGQKKETDRQKKTDRTGITVGLAGRICRALGDGDPSSMCVLWGFCSWVMQAVTVKCKYHMWVYLDLCILCLIHASGRSSKVCWVFPLQSIISHVPLVNVLQPAPEDFLYSHKAT